MKRRDLLVLWLILLVCGGVHAQSTPANNVSLTLGQSVVALNGPWKFHTGDNMAWADPGFDDSAWQDYNLLSGNSTLSQEEVLQSAELPGWQQHGHPGYTGYAWYRIRLRLPENVHSLALLMPQYIDDVYEVYVNGSKIGTFGDLNGWHLTYVGQPMLFSIPAATLDSGQPVALALRFWNIRSEASPSAHNLAGGLRGLPVIGPPAPLQIIEQSVREHMWQTLGPAQLIKPLAALYAAVGFISLFLFLFSRQQKEYLWAGISLTGFGSMLAAIGWLEDSTISVQLSVVGQALSDSAAIFAMPLAAMYLLEVPRAFWRRANYAVSAVNLAWSLQLAGLNLGLLPPTAVFDRLRSITLGVAVLSLACLLLAIAVEGVRKLGSKAWLPMTPGLLFALYCIFYTLSSLGILKGSYLLPVLICVCVPLSVLIIFLMRFTEQQRENGRLLEDMRQAQEVQQMLIPAVPPATPGFEIEHVYLPASKVGGDFFHIQHDSDGSLLVVVGDVSGKGLKAAMTVSAIIGALRGCSERTPADVLAYLNHVLHGQITGFATCAVASIAADGALTIANAGHVSPYCSGRELAVANGLPLGITAEPAYEETHFKLAPGDRLTFISDGVVEAANSRRELFGFDRAEQIINKPAATIAEAAQQWGQEDDITVLTVSRTAKLAAVTA